MFDESSVNCDVCNSQATPNAANSVTKTNLGESASSLENRGQANNQDVFLGPEAVSGSRSLQSRPHSQVNTDADLVDLITSPGTLSVARKQNPPQVWNRQRVYGSVQPQAQSRIMGNSNALFGGETFDLHRAKEGTSLRNHISQQKEGMISRFVLTTFLQLCRRLEHLCMHCLVESNGKIETVKGGCNCRGGCFTCQSRAHFKRECTVPNREQGKCFSCGLNKLNGETVHKDGFASTCRLSHMKVLSWELWQNLTTRRAITETILTEAERETILYDQNRKSGNLKARLNEGQASHEYCMWLRRGGLCQNQIRVVLWWAREAGLLGDDSS